MRNLPPVSVAALTLSLVLSAVPSWAIQFGDCESGVISSPSEVDTYTFHGVAGDVITVWMTRGANFLDPRLEVYAPGGELLAEDSDGSQARIENLSLAEPGTYTILAKDQGANGTGGYGLYLQRTNGPAQVADVSYGDCSQGSIGAVGCVGAYAFQGRAGDVVTVWMTRGTNFLDPRLDIYAPSGERVAVDWDGSQARIDTLSLTESGTYTILASDSPGNSRTGGYGLYLQRTNGPGQATHASYGDCIQGSIAEVGCVGAYAFEGLAGDVVTVWMTRGETFLDPRLEIYAPGGERLAIDWDGSQARVDTLSLPESGTYTILASDFPGDNTTGGYGLYLQRTNGPGQAVDVAYGECIQSSIAEVGCIGAYAFQGLTGDVITVWMSRGANFLDPRLEVYAPGGELLAAAWDGSRARIDALSLVEPGIYTILTSDNPGTNSTGGYGLFLQRTNDPGQAVTLSPIDCVDGAIEFTGCVDTYTFCADAGDVATMWMTRGANFLDPQLEVYAPGGELLAADSDGTEARIDTLSLAESGTYTILAGDSPGPINETGAYTMCLSCPTCPICTTAIGEEEHAGPVSERLALHKSHPNPFNPTTSIPFEVPKVSRVSLRIFTSSGRMIRSLFDTELGPGHYTVDWDGRDDRAQAVASGVYFIRLQAGDRSVFEKVVLAK